MICVLKKVWSVDGMCQFSTRTFFPPHFFFTHISENFPAPVRTQIATPANIRTHTNSMCKTLPVIFRPRIWQ